MKKFLEATVFPSVEQSITVYDSEDIYGGAHHYSCRNSRGFENGNAIYDESEHHIQFVHKLDDGTVIPGLQNEQLVQILIDRTEKLNARFPSPFNQQMLDGLKSYIAACEARIKDRMERNVMGKLKD